MMSFKEMEEKFKQLKSQFVAGQLSEPEYKTRLEEMMFQDDQGRWWMIGYETGLWHYHDGTDWVRSEPPGISGPEMVPKTALAPEKVNSVWELPDQSKSPLAPEAPKKSVQTQFDNQAAQIGNIPSDETGLQHKKVLPKSWGIGAVILVVLSIAVSLTWRFWNRPTPELIVASKNTPGLVVAATNTSLAIPVLLPTPTISLPVKPSFVIRFASSSDWADVTFEEGFDINSSDRIAISGDPSFAEREGQIISLRQDINLAIMGHQIASTYNVFLIDNNVSDTMWLTLTSGCLGQVEIELLNANVEPPVEVFRRTTGGCKDISFSVPFELLTSSTPIALVRIGPPQPDFPSSADTDESKFVFNCPETQAPNQQLCMVKAHSGQVIKLTEDFNYAGLGNPMWSGDGAEIYYLAQPFPNTAYETFVIKADGTGEAKLLSTGIGSWSPDAQTFAYSNECQVLRIMHPDGTEQYYLNTPGVRCMEGLRWSPDNTRLAFMDLFDLTKVPPSVWVINRDGTNFHRIYQFDTPVWYRVNLAWSPDGKSVGVWYLLNEKDNLHGFLLDPSGIAAAQPIDWETPFWWTPSFWPQWGN